MNPPITILFLTYSPTAKHERNKYAQKSLRSLVENLTYSGQMYWHIADDGSPVAHRTPLHKILAGHEVTETVVDRQGYGASYNRATQMTHRQDDGLVLVVEDDWELTRKLNLDPLADLLVEHADQVQCIRMGYLGHTQPLYGEVMTLNDAGALLLIHPQSPEPHVAAGHPRLETVQYERNVGPWAEGIAPGATEFDWCRRDAARKGVAWPLDYVPPRGGLFAHIGTVSLNGAEPQAEEAE